MHPAPQLFPFGPPQSPQLDISQQTTISHSAVSNAATLSGSAAQASKRRAMQRIIVAVFALALIILIYVVWNPPTPTPTASGSAITQQNFGSSSTSTNTNTSSSSTGDGNIQVYITGAVKKPGVYTLPTDARVYQLLKAAGGPQANANLVALNLAAKLTDGEEVYVTVVGEAPPTYMGGVPGPPNGTSGTPGSSTSGLVNINTATVSELEQQLHVSSTTANNIVNYRTQNGNYTSVDQLLQVISTSIFNRIKNMVTV